MWHVNSKQARAMQVVQPRGPIAKLPDQWENRREMFREIDRLQRGWTVELRSRGTGSAGGTIDAVFYDPEGEEVGAFAAARRRALAASKA
jgi:Methyl-CpG binding domain